MRFLRQFHSPLVYLLLTAAAITGVLTLRGEHMLPDMSVILAVVLLNAVLGFVQEGRTEAALEALGRMMVPTGTVLRDGTQKTVQTRELVPGDVVVLNGGDRVPADLRFFFARDVAVDESALTGESVPVEKIVECIASPDLTPGDQHCMAFSGTFVTRGSALGIVVEVGESTEFGKIAVLVGETRKVDTPLQRRISAFTRTIMIAILILAGVNLLLGYFVGHTLVYSFMASVSLVVAAIPEMLPMLVTSILALSAAAMAKRHALIRRLPAAETLGSTTVICSDKTGTLTKNEMTVLVIHADGKDYHVSGAGYQPSGEFSLDSGPIGRVENINVLIETLRAGLLCSNATLDKDGERETIVGDPTEGALVVAAAKAGLTNRPARLDEIPFSSDVRYMAVLYGNSGGNTIYVKGSPEKILSMCQSQLSENGIEPVNPERITAKVDEMAGQGLRLIAIATKSVPEDRLLLDGQDMQNLVFLGLHGLMDPPREEAIEAVRKCRRAGIRTVMITGDHVKTARAIAVQLGILDDGTRDGALTGEELSRMSDEQLRNEVDRVSVYARVAPEHKLRIAQQLQKRGHVVAMTGDGVNDAPALRAADIGVAMGISGTEVSKEASSMILTDDNFASIVAAVEEGRHAWNNLEKAILYTLPTNGGQALLITGAILLAPFVALFALRLPLEPIHILWVNLFDSVFLTMPLMMESKQKGLLDAPPRDPKTRIVNRLFVERVGLVSATMAAIGFLVFWGFGNGSVASNGVALTQAQTAALMSIVLVHLGYVMTARSTLQSAFTLNPFSNRWLLGGIAVTIAANLMMVYAPFMNDVFRTAAFPAHWWPLVIIGLPAGFIVPELEKLVRRVFEKRANSRPH
jgi:magnesium-transporting ATPase (P-type)